MKKLLNLSLLVDETEIDSVIEKSQKLIKHPGCVNFHAERGNYPVYYTGNDIWACKSVVINFDKYNFYDGWTGSLEYNSYGRLMNIFRYWSNIAYCGKIGSYAIINDSKVVCSVDMSKCSSSDPMARGIFESLFFCLANGVVFKKENKHYRGFGAENIKGLLVSDESALDIVRNSVVENHKIFKL